jgi:hypothetical protein
MACYPARALPSGSTKCIASKQALFLMEGRRRESSSAWQERHLKGSAPERLRIHSTALFQTQPPPSWMRMGLPVFFPSPREIGGPPAVISSGRQRILDKVKLPAWPSL